MTASRRVVVLGGLAAAVALVAEPRPRPHCDYTNTWRVSWYGDGPGGGWADRSRIDGIEQAAGADWVGPLEAGDPPTIAPTDKRTYLMAA